MTTAEFPAYVNVVVIFPLGLARGGSAFLASWPRAWALSSSWPRPWTLSTLWLGSVAGPCPLVLLVAAPLNSVNSVAGLCGWALSPSCPPSIQQLCGPALWPGSVSGSCPPLVLVLAAPLNSVARLCVRTFPRRTNKQLGSLKKFCVFSFLSLVCYISIHLPYI